MGSWFFALVQFFPLSLFATYAFWYGLPSNERWVEAFQLAGAAGLLQLAIVVPQRDPMNRLVLAANLYLVLGGVAALSEQWWCLQLYGALRESAIFLWILLVGLVATFATSAGFVGATGICTKNVRVASYWLILATLMALAVSLAFEGDRTIAAVVPIAILAVLQHLLLSWPAKRETLEAEA